SVSAAREHGAQAPRNQQGHHDVDKQEGDDGGHGKEMHETRRIVASEKGSELLQLNGLPDGKPGKHEHKTGDEYAQIKDLLHRVVGRKICVGQLSAKSRAEVGEDIGQAYGDEHAPEAAAREPEQKIDEAVDRKNPHGRKMPQQCARKTA